MARTQQRSIRFRLTAWYSLALAAGLALFAVSIWVSMRHVLLRDIDQNLAQGVQSVQLFIDHELGEPGVQLPEELDEYAHAFPPDTFAQIRDHRGSIVFATPQRFARRGFAWPETPGGHPRIQAVAWRGHSYRVIVQSVPVRGKRWTISLAAPLANADALLRRLRFLLLMLSPVVLVVGTLGGAWLSRRALNPVDQMTVAASSIGIENLSQRLAVPKTGDELQRLAETWNRMLSRLDGAVNRISRFTADASHELRTPLAVIRSTAEVTLRRSRSGPEYEQALAQIASESEHMTALIEDLLFLARSDADSLALPMTEVRLAPLVAEVCTRLQVLAEQNHVRLDCRVLPRFASCIRGNKEAVRRLFLVLIDNAVKYSRPGGTVLVDLALAEREVRFAVQDSGPGIPDSEVERIFERFYRSPGARQVSSRGSGLGLALAASIAHHHAARISVISTAGSGSTFTVAFPVTPSAAGSHVTVSQTV